MKTNHLILDDGIIEIEEEYLVITDKAKQTRTIEILLFICSICYSIPTAIKGFKDKDYFFFVLGLLISVCWIYEIGQQIFKGVFSNRLYVARLPIDTIDCITFQHNRFGLYVTSKITLQDKKYREIRTTPQYLLESHFIDILQSKGINVSNTYFQKSV